MENSRQHNKILLPCQIYIENDSYFFYIQNDSLFAMNFEEQKNMLILETKMHIEKAFIYQNKNSNENCEENSLRKLSLIFVNKNQIRVY